MRYLTPSSHSNSLTIMKVLFILDPVAIGGATRSFLNLAKELQKFEVEITVCLSEYSFVCEELDEKNIPYIITKHQDMLIPIATQYKKNKAFYRQRIKDIIRSNIEAIRILKKSINIREFDLIHTNTSCVTLGHYLSAIFRIPHVVHLREYNDLDHQLKQINPYWPKLYNLFTTKFICISESIQKHYIKKGLNEVKTIVIYNGIDTDKIQESSDESKLSKQLHLVMCGTVFPAKGHSEAIKAIGLLPQEIKENIYLDIIGEEVGKAYKDGLVELEKTFSLVNPVRYHGYKRNVLEMLGNYQIGLMCSPCEAFGRTTAEFMFARMGVIGANSGGTPELIEDMKRGLLYESCNPASLSEKIKYLYFNREQLIKFSIAGQTFAREHFTAEVNAKAIFDLYKTIVK